MDIDRVVDGLIAIDGVKTVDVRGSEIRVKLLHPADIDWDQALRGSGANFIVREEKKDNASYTFLLGDSCCTLNVYSTARNNHNEFR